MNGFANEGDLLIFILIIIIIKCGVLFVYVSSRHDKPTFHITEQAHNMPAVHIVSPATTGIWHSILSVVYKKDYARL